MQTVRFKSQTYPAVEARKLENGMIFRDGSEIDCVVIGEKTVRFVLIGRNVRVERTVRAGTMMALSYEQVAVVL